MPPQDVTTPNSVEEAAIAKVFRRFHGIGGKDHAGLQEGETYVSAWSRVLQEFDAANEAIDKVVQETLYRGGAKDKAGNWVDPKNQEDFPVANFSALRAGEIMESAVRGLEAAGPVTVPESFFTAEEREAGNGEFYYRTLGERVRKHEFLAVRLLEAAEVDQLAGHNLAKVVESIKTFAESPLATTVAKTGYESKRALVDLAPAPESPGFTF